MRTALVAQLVIMSVVLAGIVIVPASSAAADSGDGTTVLIDYGTTGWSYLDLARGDYVGLTVPGYDDSAWAVGQGGFGTTGATCPWNSDSQVKTSWTPLTDLFLRRHFSLPSGVTTVHIEGTVDNNASIYVNGHDVQDAAGGFCQSNNISIDVPATYLATGDNLLAAAATDDGEATFIDLRVSYAGPPENLKNVLYKPGGDVDIQRYAGTLLNHDYVIMAADATTARPGFVTLSSAFNADGALTSNVQIKTVLTDPEGNKTEKVLPPKSGKCAPADPPVTFSGNSYTLAKPGKYVLRVTIVQRCQTVASGRPIWIEASHPIVDGRPTVSASRPAVLPAASSRPLTGSNDCTATGSLVWQWFGPSHITKDGQDNVAGTIQTTSYDLFCGTSFATVTLQVKQCHKLLGCTWVDLNTTPMQYIASNAVQVFPAVAHPRLAGTNTYRLELQYFYPQVSIEDDTLAAGPLGALLSLFGDVSLTYVPTVKFSASVKY